MNHVSHAEVLRDCRVNLGVADPAEGARYSRIALMHANEAGTPVKGRTFA